MLYFAYGSNLNWHQMKEERCPGSKYIQSYILKGYKLIFSHRNPNNKYGTSKKMAENVIQQKLKNSKIKLIFFPNSSITSIALVGLTLVDMFALGIANGKFNFFKRFLITTFFGNLTAILFKFAFAKKEILESFFFWRIYVRGPGENFL